MKQNALPFLFTVEKLTQLAEGEKTAAEELLVCLEEAVWDKMEHQEISK